MQAVQHFRQNVKAAIVAAGISQSEFARRAELGRPFLNRVLRGHAEPSLDVCDRIADALGLDLMQLLSSPKKFPKKRPTALAG